jgi:hypothetical protein
VFTSLDTYAHAFCTAAWFLPFHTRGGEVTGARASPRGHCRLASGMPWGRILHSRIVSTAASPALIALRSRPLLFTSVQNENRGQDPRTALTQHLIGPAHLPVSTRCGLGPPPRERRGGGSSRCWVVARSPSATRHRSSASPSSHRSSFFGHVPCSM